MKNVFVVLALVLAVGLSACQQSRTAAASKAETAAMAAKGQQFGAAITPDGAITYDELLAKNINEPTNLKVKGRVSEVCQAKGCWMNIVSDKGSDNTMKVRFKDYGFFMPKDISGREVIMEGVASIQEVSVDELRHYAEDAGKSQDEINAITKPRRELSFLASGVILLDK
jgi:hypothetical protein